MFVRAGAYAATCQEHEPASFQWEACPYFSYALAHPGVVVQSALSEFELEEKRQEAKAGRKEEGPLWAFRYSGFEMDGNTGGH